MVVQVTALERTHESGPRAPVFLRMKDDKEPWEYTIDQLGRKKEYSWEIRKSMS